MLEGASVMTGTDFFSGLHAGWRSLATRLVYTGRIDEFYGYRFGSLNYRSLRFEHEVIDTPNYQGVAIMNFTGKEIPWTRIVEHKHFQSFGDGVYLNPTTVITREYPSELKDGCEPYYPVNDLENGRMYSKYKKLADAEDDVVFVGRLAEYKYCDMDKAVQSALKLWDEEKDKQKQTI